MVTIPPTRSRQITERSPRAAEEFDSLLDQFPRDGLGKDAMLIVPIATRWCCRL
jgi:hypothetical protein